MTAKQERVERGIRRLPNGRYEVRVHVARDPVTGRQRQVSRTVKGIREARATRSRLEHESAQGGHGGTRTTFGVLLDEWDRHRVSLGCSPTTLHEDHHKIERVIRPAIGPIELTKLDTRALDRFYGARRDAGDSPALIAHYHRLIRAALSQAVKWGWLPVNPAKSATVGSVPKPELHIPTVDEVRRLITTAEKSRNPGLAEIVLFAAMTGLRAGELCALRFSDMDGVALTVRHSAWVRGGKSGVKDPKGHQVRTITLNLLAQETIRRRWETLERASAVARVTPTDGYVWSPDGLGTRPMSPRGLSQAFWRLARKAGVGCRLHDLRHFMATQGLAAGFDLITVSRWLGHKHPSTTSDIYGHALRERTEALGDYLGGLLTPNDETPPAVEAGG